MGLNLTTKDEYKTYAGIKSTNDDDIIDRLIMQVSEFVKTFCGRTFVDYFDIPKVESFNGGSDSFILAETPIVDVVSVEYSEDFGKTYTLLAEYDSWVLDNNQIISTSKFDYKLKGYRVSYTGGYEDVPPDLKLAVMDMITYYRKNDSAVHSIRLTNPNTAQVQYVNSNNLPPHIQRVLLLHKSDFS